MYGGVTGKAGDPYLMSLRLSLWTFHPGLKRAEAEKRVVDLQLLELQATDANRRPLLAEIETLKQRLRKTDAEISETNRQIAKDESLLAGKKDLTGLTEREKNTCRSNRRTASSDPGDPGS